ncbi:hypothetical protein VPH35_088276 [Triticum aestivum]
MAANFWASSRSKQLLDPEEVDVVPAADRERGITLVEFPLSRSTSPSVSSQAFWWLAQQVKVRQTVIATAITYFRRVYKVVAQLAIAMYFFVPQNVGSDDKYRVEIKDILEMEMKLLEALDYYLVVFHPYQIFYRLLQDAGITDLTQFAWGLVNDTYKMDLILIYPPYMIALACICIASVLKDEDMTSWFEELHADMNILSVKNISVEIKDFYDTYKIDPNRYLQEDKIIPVMNKLPSNA